MKKLAGILILLVMTCVVSAALAVSSGTSEHMTWVLDKYGTLTIAGKGTMDKDFCDEQEIIKKVVIRQGITSVSNYAFLNCTDLTTVILPESVKTIGVCAFYGCSKLTDVTMPDSVETIGNYAFLNCAKLKKLSIPKKLTSIGASVLAGTGVRSVTVPENLTSIGSNAFGSAKIYAAIGTNGAKALGKAGMSFRVSGGKYDLQYVYDENRLQDLVLCAVDDTVKKLKIPQGVTKLGNGAFSGRDALTEVVFPSTLTSIGENVFQSCRGLKKVTLPASLQRIGANAFYYWNGTATFLGNAPMIDDDAFHYSTMIVIYPHDNPSWTAASRNTYKADWICWQADNEGTVKEPDPKSPSENPDKTKTDNDGDHNYSGNWSGTVDSYLIPGENGAFTRVEHTGNTVIVEQYSAETVLQWKKTLSTELTLWGGFYSGTDYNFFVFGQENYEEDDGKEVIRVVRYDKNWNRMDSVSAYGQNTSLPFRAGTVDMDQSGDYLYIHTSHQMYTSDDGKRHQANMTFKLYIPGMSFSLDNSTSPGYTSHSFNQIIYVDEGNLIMIDHGDAYPRAVTIGRSENDTDAPGNDNFKRVTLLKIGGETGDNYTGVTVGGSKASDTRYIVTGKSIDQDHFDTSTRDNIYVVTASKSDFSDATVVFRWQTKYQEGSTVVLSNPYLIRISGKKLLLIWTEKLNNSDLNELLYYVFLNEEGAAASEVYSNPGKLSDVEPVVNNNSVTWYVTTGKDVIFYSLDLNNPKLISTVSDLVWLGKAGWQQDGAGNWLYGNSEGYAVVGLQTIAGNLYYFNSNGVMATGWFRDENGTRYCAAPSGILYTNGWHQVGRHWYYFRANGTVATGWIYDGRTYYYLGDDGAMQTGWLQYGGRWYYLDASGAMRTGWVQDGGKWYYLNTSGVMQTGWILSGGKWYYLGESGAMQTGWVQADGGRYYLGSDGTMRTGWVQIDGNWYYLKGNGLMQTGWFEDKSSQRASLWFWFDNEGKMATGLKLIDGRHEMFGENGVWLYTQQ